MLASNYFNQFSAIDSAKHLAALLGNIPQVQLWWYHGAIGKTLTRPEVPSAAVFKKYPQLQLVQAVRGVFPIAPRPAVAATSNTGSIHAPTFMVCGSLDPYLLCDSAIAKESKNYIGAGVEYKHGSFACKHGLFKECISEAEATKVMTQITAWILKNNQNNNGRRVGTTGRAEWSHQLSLPKFRAAQTHNLCRTCQANPSTHDLRSVHYYVVRAHTCIFCCVFVFMVLPGVVLPPCCLEWCCRLCVSILVFAHRNIFSRCQSVCLCIVALSRIPAPQRQPRPLHHIRG